MKKYNLNQSKNLKIIFQKKLLAPCFILFLLINFSKVEGQIPTTGSSGSGIRQPCPPVATCIGYQSDQYANPLSEMYAHIDISNNGPVCVGSSITLSGSSLAGVSYSWTGPDNFISNQQNPTFIATPLSGGIYTLSVDLVSHCTITATTEVFVSSCNFLTLDVKMFIEGYYLSSGQMRALLFNQGISADPTACDTVVVELHDGIFPFASAASVKAILHTNGHVIAQFPLELMNEPRYIVILHQNALDTWSKFPVLFGSPDVSFDFTSY